MAPADKSRIGTGSDPGKSPVPRPPVESITRNTVFAMGVQLSGAAFTAGLTLFLVRYLEPDAFGVLALALSIGGLVNVPSDFGISASASRFIAEHRDDEEAIGDVLARALKLKLAVAALVSALLISLAGVIAEAYDQPALAWPVRAIGIAVFGQSLMLLFSGAFIAQGRTSRNLRLVLSESVFEFTATVALVLLGGGAAGAAFGRAIGFTLGAALGLGFVLRTLKGRVLSRDRAPSTRRIAGYAGNLAIVDWVYSSLHHADAIILGALVNSTAVGFFQAPIRLIVFFNYPGAALASGVAPRLAGSGGVEAGRDAFLRALRILVIVQTGLLALLLVWANPIVTLLLGNDFRESADALRALAPYVFFSGFAALVSLSANYLGMGRKRIPIALAAFAINLILDFLLIPKHGVAGAGVATSAGFAVYVPAHLQLCRRAMDLPLRATAVSFARCLLAAAALAGTLLAFGTSELSFTAKLSGGTLGLLAYVAVLMVTRELDRTDLRRARAAARRRLGREG